MIVPKNWKVFEISSGICYTEPGDSMYNREIKERFLASGYGSVQHSKLVFNKGEPVEIELGKDIAEMNKEEAKTLINACGFEGYPIIDSVLSALRRYVEFCEDNKVFRSIPRGVFNLRSSEINVSESIHKTLFRDETDFVSTLRSVREFDQGYPEPPFLCLVWLGLKPKEAIALKDDDIDIEKQTIVIDGKTVISKFSAFTAEILQQYVDCKVAERDHRTGWRQVIKDYSTGFFLKKMLPRGHKDFGKPFSASRISAAISDLNNILEEENMPARLKPDNIWNSGRYYAMWEMERSGVDVMSPDNRKLVEGIFRNSKNYHTSIRMYKAYKQAFDLP